MDKKFFAFLIFPGAHGRLHKMQLPFYVIASRFGSQCRWNHGRSSVGQYLCQNASEGFKL